MCVLLTVYKIEIRICIPRSKHWILWGRIYASWDLVYTNDQNADRFNILKKFRLPGLVLVKNRWFRDSKLRLLKPVLPKNRWFRDLKFRLPRPVFQKNRLNGSKFTSFYRKMTIDSAGLSVKKHFTTKTSIFVLKKFKTLSRYATFRSKTCF